MRYTFYILACVLHDKIKNGAVFSDAMIMGIIVNVDVMMAKRKMSSQELAEKIGITPVNLSVLKTGKAKAIRFSTLEAICKALDCQPGDILEYVESPEMDES